MYKILIIVLLITSLFPYLHWADKSAFLFQIEFALFQKSNTDLQSFVHPAVAIPMIGQLLLLVALFRKPKSQAVVITAIVCLSLLILLIFFIGLLAFDYRIIFSTLPFLIASGYYIIKRRTL